MNNSLVSIIIPVYNVETYLRECVESVISQTYTNIEIWLIDDGSKDLSGIICDQYTEKDERVKVVHKENGGLSSARNIGLDYANGEYILFLDSDDIIPNDAVKVLLEVLEKNNVDIAIGNIMFFEENIANIQLNQGVDDKIKLFTSEKAIEESLYQLKFSCSPCSRIYRKKIFEEIRFPVGKLSEDLAVCHRIFDKSNNIAYINHTCYYYRQRSSSIMHTFNEHRMDALTWTNEIEKYCNENHPGIIKAAKCRTFNVAIHLMLDLPQNGQLYDKYVHVLWKEITRTRKSVIFDNKARSREKIAAVLSYIGENALRSVWNSKFAVKRKMQ